jgi:sodium pump decarboxylase gamma subunit
MLYGMGVVFFLLTLLVFGVLASSRAARWLERDSRPEESPAPESTAVPMGDPMLAAVIGAAVARFRANHR